MYSIILDYVLHYTRLCIPLYLIMSFMMLFVSSIIFSYVLSMSSLTISFFFIIILPITHFFCRVLASCTISCYMRGLYRKPCWGNGPLHFVPILLYKRALFLLSSFLVLSTYLPVLPLAFVTARLSRLPLLCAALCPPY